MKKTSGLRVTKIGFDNLENRDGEVVLSEKIFEDGPDGSAYKKAEEWLSSLEPEHRYLGWDERVYPMFTVEKIEIN